MTNPFDVGGRIVVLTGGCGQLGQQWTRALVEAGARVFIVDTVDTVLDWHRTAGWPVFTFGASVTDPQAMADALTLVVDQFGGPPHALVNAAAIDSKPGTPGGMARPEDYSVEEFRRVMDVNVTGVQVCTQVFGAAMAEAGRGSIVNISSIYGNVGVDQRIYEGLRQAGQPFWKPAAYSASKSALLNLTRYWAAYLAPKGVRVNTLSLGSMGRDDYHPSFAETFTAKVPMGRFARPGEFDGALLWLLSDASSYVTGANIVADGGLTAW